jgi:hypothetical protein
VADKLHWDRKAKEDDWSWLFDGIPARDALPALPLGYPLSALLAASKEDGIAVNPLIVDLAAQRRDTLAAQKRTLACTLNHWLDECGVAVAIDWSGSVVDFRLAPSHPLGFGPDVRRPSGEEAGHPLEMSALAAIGAELLWAVMRRDSVARCADCNGWYDPRKRRKGRKQSGRWPRTGESHYCPKCGKKAANKFNQRKYREREKARKKGEVG